MVIDDCVPFGCYYNIQIQQMLFKRQVLHWEMLNVIFYKRGRNHAGSTTVANEGAPTFFDVIRERLSVSSDGPEIKISRKELTETLRQAPRWLLQLLS